LPASIFLEWMEYQKLEPWGAWRDNWHAALQATIFASAFRDPKRPPPKMHEFFYQDPETARDKQDMEMLAILDSLKKRNG
jgi:hypothetical protein